MENSSVVPTTELDYYINKSGSELNGILASAYGSKYSMKKQAFSVNGTTDTYPLSYDLTFNTGTGAFGLNLVVTGATSGAKGTVRAISAPGVIATGTLSLSDVTGTFLAAENITDTATGAAKYASNNGGIGAADFMELQALDLMSGGKPYPVREFKLGERALYQLPQANLSFYGAPFAYRFQGQNIVFAPTPAATFALQMLYTPAWKVLVATTDTVDGVDGWDELIVLDVCIKVLAKQDLPSDVFILQKQAMLARIDGIKQQRNVSEAPRITDVNDNMPAMSTFGRFGW